MDRSSLLFAFRLGLADGSFFALLQAGEESVEFVAIHPFNRNFSLPFMVNLGGLSVV